MLGYAQSRPRIAARRSSPNTMLVVIVVHVTLIALVMSAKMDLPQKIIDGPLMVDLIHEPAPPPPNPAEAPRPPIEASLSQPASVVPTPPSSSELVDASPTPVPSGELLGPATAPEPRVDPLPPPAPVRNAARLLTSGAALRPDYPAAKLMSGEEADLQLKLTIAASGRVVAVEPIGRADPVFLAAARRHLIARWRFAPATEDGRALVSSTIVTLRFRLD
jgi:protein TonB